MGKKILINGLIAGLIMTAFFWISHELFMKEFKAEAWETSEVVGYSSMIIALTAVFFGIKSYRDKVLGGKITFGKAFLLGIGISAVAAIIFGIYVYALNTVISPELSGKMIEVYREKIKTSGKAQDEIKKQLEQFDAESGWWQSPFLQSFVMFITVFMIGILISLISAAILRRREPMLVT